MSESASPAGRSAAQRAAARVNGARSRGPVGAEGKARASRNALRHGLCAQVHLVAAGEEPAALERLRAELRAEYADPRPSRALLVERLAAAVWKLRRAERLEAALHGLAPRPPEGRLDPEPGLPAALTRLPEYATLVRHQGQLERFLLRALRTLEAPADPTVGLRAAPGPAAAADHPVAEEDPGAAGEVGEDRDPGVDEGPSEDFAQGEDGDPEEDTDPPEDGDPGGAAGVEAAGLAGLARACAARLLAQGRVREAARLVRLCTGARAGPADEPPLPETDEARLARTLAGLTPEERADWDSLGYETWVVPPGTGRRPLAALDAAWVCPADRWRVLEELTRLDDPAEEARVLDHFRRAGLDPGLDHPAFAGRIDPPAPPAAPADEGATPGAPPDPPAGRDPAFHALLVRLGQEAEAHHGAGRARRAALAWRRHAGELGVPVPAHAGLGMQESGSGL